MFGNSWLCACTSSVEWDAAVARPEVRQTGQSTWRHFCRSVQPHGDPENPIVTFPLSYAYRTVLPLTYVPATVRHGWLDSGHGCGQCTRARHPQCRRLYHDPVRPTIITVLGPGDRITVSHDTYKYTDDLSTNNILLIIILLLCARSRVCTITILSYTETYIG